jgi:hypothetical protein
MGMREEWNAFGDDLSDAAFQRARADYPRIDFGTGDLLNAIKLTEVLATSFVVDSGSRPWPYFRLDETVAPPSRHFSVFDTLPSLGQETLAPPVARRRCPTRE